MTDRDIIIGSHRPKPLRIALLPLYTGSGLHLVARFALLALERTSKRHGEIGTSLNLLT